MVDPKRHINVLSEEDQMFLNECEEEFKDRFSENDAEFQAYCEQAPKPPPVLHPWQNRNPHSGGQYGGRGQRRGGHYNNRGGRSYRDHRDRPYDSSYRNQNYRHRSDGNGRDNRHHYNRR
ncbi:RNA guanine-N7 methyltransferase activating subunit [Wyeomyia smithii]|uniref:RNA guanine-N7 methyltransferase activating subunit n=1 Tax=Wyeomyia smithii TaxID=174621 RepID=UPI0024681D28|nr:RNA guanine-N7 methyltransferase activating subunit [Wyeomyia smithii]